MLKQGKGLLDLIALVVMITAVFLVLSPVVNAAPFALKGVKAVALISAQSVEDILNSNTEPRIISGKIMDKVVIEGNAYISFMPDGATVSIPVQYSSLIQQKEIDKAKSLIGKKFYAMGFEEDASSKYFFCDDQADWYPPRNAAFIVKKVEVVPYEFVPPSGSWEKPFNCPAINVTLEDEKGSDKTTIVHRFTVFKRCFESLFNDKYSSINMFMYYMKQGCSAQVAEAMVNNMLVIGMTENEAYVSIGYPDDVSTSTGSWGEHKQAIYRRGIYKYVYFENDRLTSWQE